MSKDIAIFFDVDDTLYNQREPFEKAFETVFGHIKNVDINKLYLDRHKYSDEVFEKSCNGEITMEEMYIYRISKAFETQGIKVSDKSALDFQYEYSKNQNNIKISDTIKNMLDFCCDNSINIGIITNGLTKHQKNKIKSLGLYKWIEDKNIFISEDVGFAKPDKSIFKAAEKAFLSKDIYYVGDSFKNDIEGGNSAGWKTVWLNKRNYVVESFIKADYCAKSEEELFEIIKNICI